MESDIDCTICLVVDSIRHGSRFLDSLFRTADPVSLEVIVVNPGPENELDFLKKEFPGVVICENNIRETMARTRNRVFRSAKGRYLSFWRDEIVFLPDCLFRLIDFLDDNPAVGIVGPALETITEQPLISSAAFPDLFSWLRAGASLVAGGTEPSAAGQFEVDWLSGAALVINPNLVDEIGIFDQSFPCCEEIDYCFRARKAGWHIHLVPSARAVYRYPVLKQPDWTWSGELFAGLRFLQKKWFTALKK
jgi:GT2 family glycosyltransferase